MPIAYQFLPWVRRGLSVALDTPDTLGAGGAMPARATAQVGVKLAGAHAATAIEPLTLRLYGPGDVIGIDPQLVVRTDPKPHATNFEPNYLAIIDFDPPDFPWMLTPARANGDDRLRPWLVLVVLDLAKTGRPRLQGPSLLPAIRVKGADVAAELPDLAESWSWAHAQVISAAGTQPGIQADLQADARSNISRLVCPRRLQPNKDYLACVVPAFEPGRLRGLGLAGGGNNPAMDALAPAWNLADAADVLLPVYHHWEFSTGPAGDFESLARRLRTPGSYKGTPVAEQLKAVGTAPMQVDDILNGDTPGLLTTMEGALVPISYQPGEPAQPTHAKNLQFIVNTPHALVADPLDAQGKRIEVKPPMVGAWHAKKHEVQLAEEGRHWLAGLNLNPRYRGAAGYGAEVVRRNQEVYVDASWDQLGDILQAEMRLNLTRLAIEAQGALKRKHFDPLPPERLLQIMGPALPRIEAFSASVPAYRINGVLGSLGGQIDRSSLPAALTDSALRRAASPQRRALRLAARLNGRTAALAGLATSYVGSMAQASSKPAAFAVNAFIPDGILGTRVFDGLNLGADANALVDLGPIGLKGRFSAGRIRQVVAGGEQAKAALQRNGVPELKIRPGQLGGVVTDVHVDRFGALAATVESVRPTDWALVASRIEGLGRRGVEGFLVEADQESAELQVSAMRVDGRSGQLHLDRTLVRFDAERRELSSAAAKQARGRSVARGARLAQVNVQHARQFRGPGLLASLPVNAVSTHIAAGPALNFTLTPGLEFGAVHRPPVRPPAASVTLPPALREREVLRRFSLATQKVQAQWRDPFERSRVQVQVVDFALDSAAGIIRARTLPELTLQARLAQSVSIARTELDRKNAFASPFLRLDPKLQQRFMIPALFDRVMAWPHLREPMYAALAGYDAEAFMPGVGDLPQDLIMLVQVNQFFIDSFMAGANFEMNRELLWRGFPTDMRGTPFQRFWGRVRPDAGGRLEELDDMQPMHTWGAQPLGRRVDINLTDPNRIALLVRGQLLRRYPNTAVYAWERNKSAPAGQSQLKKNPDGTPVKNAVQTPVFAGFIGPDITFFGFDIDREKVGDWCFVLEEQMSEPRFGFDVDEQPVEAQGGGVGPKRRVVLREALQKYALAGNELVARKYNPYKALSWTQVGVQPGGFAGLQHLMAPDVGFADFPSLAATATAAEVAKALLQQPFRAYYVGNDLKS